ncbi:MAG: LysM peptidoglycan-binding domain-containing protein [Muribaculaceae bacterium]|nr:LysM peptidoglycan-binding domain-containing protein [Muribaculaceae bacterium]
MRITVKDRQSLLDLAVKNGGSIETAMAIAEANGINITDELTDGQELEIPEPLMNADGRTAGRYATLGLEPATELSAEDMAACPYGGINYMGIEIDFEVS